MLTGGQDVQAAGKLGVVAQDIMSGLACGKHAMVGGQQDQGALTDGGGEALQQVLFEAPTELGEFGGSAFIVGMVEVREVVDLTGVDPEILALAGVGFDEMAQVDPQLARGEVAVHAHILEEHL